ncbi:MAG TPA: carotenoid oxygenase family protein [Solirubrobacteraceae bacterium]|jgi:carotenoid cleavage dioxygenase-like enzyme
MSTVTVSTSPRRGFDSLQDEVRLDRLEVQGTVPSWLTGSLIRTGPALWDLPGQTMSHWFDGLAMLHRFSFADQSVSYANRFLETRAYRAAREHGRLSYSEFATDPCRSLFQRVTAMFSPAITDNANVNLVKLGERFVAMTETPLPVQFDRDTLAAAGLAYRAPGHISTAHPHMDRGDRGMINYAAQLGPRSSYRFFHLPPGSETPQVIARRPVREPAYMHSFGLTERWLVLMEFPLVVNPLRLALSGRPFIENYRWRPELGTRIQLLSRTGEADVGPFQTDARFGFHHVNAYEEGQDVIVDVCTYPDAGIVQDLYLERLRAGKPITGAALERFRISPGSGEVTVERLLDEAIELPRINYGRCNERPYRYAWGVGSAGGWLDRIVKGDLVARTSQTWQQDGAFPGEPVFVAAPDAKDEDEGVLLSVVLDGRRETSFLLILDAGTLEELARAEVPHAIPFGFHGSFTP